MPKTADPEQASRKAVGMVKRLRLEPASEKNWQELVDLEVDDSQDDFVADNVYSIAESKFNSDARPVGIFDGKKAVGFLMYDIPNDKTGTYEIYRLMVDQRYQGQGYGRAALLALLKKLGQAPDCKRITICYVPGNMAAKKFYDSLGFQDIGRNEDGEVIAELRPQ